VHVSQYVNDIVKPHVDHKMRKSSGCMRAPYSCDCAEWREPVGTVRDFIGAPTHLGEELAAKPRNALLVAISGLF
ncbi:MAG TPA: hypothetical protein VL137_05105, partial [Polyangiaceae bacterium]|nr:hypothetical protein [Polyangiaceae bacterium]